ncbi:hypothetical protein [Vibrio parahaemolyticus]|uniref:hypothetical protein n=1 Tax=Vibrio parahaemolyticus TaxID=670 RepID=UPI001E4831B0|nr:hypothetical protein [Vibrio parahaemolyticus]
MDTISEIVVNGIREKNSPGGIVKLHTVVSIAELLSYLPDEHPLFDTISSSFERPINAKRTKSWSEAIRLLVVKNEPTSPIRATLVINGNVKEKVIINDYNELIFNRHNIVLIEGFNVISSICELLETPNPFTNKLKVSSPKLAPQYLALLQEIEVDLCLCYSQQGRLEDNVIFKLLSDTNSLETNVYTQNILINRHPDSPLLAAAEELKCSLRLDEFGGVTTNSKITKSDSYIATRNTLIYIILAGLGGRNLRIEKKLPKQLPDNTEITKELIEKNLPSITSFMSGWIKGLEKEFKQDTNGFHRSMQIWQALGLVIFHARTHLDYTLADYYEAGVTLSNLDYSKEASHWEQCSAFKKDATNTYWINATGGGRTLRDKVAEYFIKILNKGDNTKSLP